MGAREHAAPVRGSAAPRSAPALARSGAAGRGRRGRPATGVLVDDTLINRRRMREYDVGRVRWEATKIVLAPERRFMREEKPMDYRSYVTGRAGAGDLAARRVLDALESPARHRQERSAGAPSERVTLDQVRERLNIIGAEEEACYEQAQVERQRLARVERPPTIEQALASARKEIQTRIGEATQFTPAQRAQLEWLSKEQQSWNPFVRNAAKKETQKLHVE